MGAIEDVRKWLADIPLWRELANRARTIGVVIVAVGADLACHPALALEYGKWQQMNHSQTAMVYLRGAAEGISWANIALDDGHKLYCEPRKLTVTVGQYEEILKQYLVGKADPTHQHIEMLLVFALQDTFPCPK
ncbi:MAG: hypothetical protein E5X67_32880 [Mesorhizobium sp.]|uniref:hypothetical protein n=1 Tax=Mesorhizobium sp. TaxID=1871066 RepID=UPI0011FB1A31|nr:hypothetical protein [Mesorhizobium sp.]TIP23528.1 MAG: hypothetical protein E5X67_32880 [Mesorhizobium sp.]